LTKAEPKDALVSPHESAHAYQSMRSTLDFTFFTIL
jgi:hypothetical protein